MRTIHKILAVLLLPLAVTAVQALDAGSDASVARLFTASDVVANLQYPTGFSGVPWDDASITRFELGSTVLSPTEFMAQDGAGNLYLVVHGQTGPDLPRYKGLVRYDGTNFEHLVQDVLDPDSASGLTTGSRVLSVTVSQATVGRLTAGHPVIVREVYPAGGGTATDRTTEMWSVDPSTSPATETLVHALTGGLGEHAVIDGNGAVYVFAGGTVRKLAWNGSSYDESILITGLGLDGMVLGDDDALYAFAGDTTWGARRGNNDILRIDASNGSTSVHAAVSKKFGGLRSFTIGTAGRTWLGLIHNGAEIVAEAIAGGTLGTKGLAPAASTGISQLRSVAADAGGDVLVAEWSSPLADAETVVYALTPGTSGGGGGGGKGGGKGK